MPSSCAMPRRASRGRWLAGPMRLSSTPATAGMSTPPRALLDCYTIRERRGSLAGLRVAIVGDVKHSRVARSNVLAFSMLGAEVTLVAPPTLLPPSLAGWPVAVSHDLDGVLPKADVVYLLRMHRER